MWNFVVLALLPVAFAAEVPSIPATPEKSGFECIAETIQQFGQSKWADAIKWDAKKDFEAAPLSLAFWNWCWFRIDEQIDPKTKKPCAAATREGAKRAPEGRRPAYEKLAKALESCEKKRDAKTLNHKITITNDITGEKAPQEHKDKADFYKEILELTSCVNEFYTEESDYDANIKYIIKHDTPTPA